MVAAMRFTAERPGVVIRRRPAADGMPMSLLEKGDEVVASDVFIEEGVEWVKLAAGSEATRANGSVRKVPLELLADGFVAIEDPQQGTVLRKHTQVVVEERKEEGVLTKAEIKEILERSSDPTMALPLEAKYWERQQLEMFVMSGGTIRPRWCSMPDERLMANTNMGKEEIMRALGQAADWLANADALLIGSGAGMGVDSGLGTFRGGQRGVWQGLEAVGLAYEEICDSKWFHEEPRLAWAFWDHCYRVYQETTPHDGYAQAREWGQRCPLGYFSFTSNIDSHWTASGASADRVLEVHGALRWLQCSKPCCPDVWKAPKDHGLSMLATHRVAGDLPTCPKCKAVARPNVQMFGGDTGFSKARRVAQFGKYDAWLKQLEARPDRESLRVTCLEVGCGLTVPTVRKELEAVLRKFPQARLVRVNPENPGISQDLADRGVSLPLRAGAAIQELRRTIGIEGSEVTFILWGKEGGCEVRAPGGTCLGRLLRLAQAEEGMAVELGQDVRALCQEVLGRTEEVQLDACVPSNCFRPVKVPGGSELEVAAVLSVGAKFSSSRHPGNMNGALARRIDEVRRLLDDMNALFEEPEYQAEVRRCRDKRSVLKTARTVHFQVLPGYGLEASERGTAAMTHLIASVQSLPEIQAKVDKSMDLSYVRHMGHLPSVEAPASRLAAAEVPPAAPTSLQIRLTAPAPTPGEEAETAQVEAPTQATIGELRSILRRLWCWDEAAAAAAQFFPAGSAGDPLQDADRVREALVVRGAPLRRPPEAVEVTFTEMAPEAEEKPNSIRLRLMSDCTVAALRGLLGEACGWDEQTRKRARFLIKLSGGFGGLREQERIEARRAIFVHGAPLERLPGGCGEAAAPRAAAAAEEQRWTRCPHCDLPGSPVEQMDASDLAAVRRRVEQMGFSGFSIWEGRAYLKSAGKALRREDLDYKGVGNPVEFHLFTAPMPSKARGLSLESALSLQRELMDGFGAPEFQQRLQQLKTTLQGPSARKFAGERMRLLLVVQRAVLPKYGFEGSLGGIMEMMEAFGTRELQSCEEVHRNGVLLEQLLA